MIYSVEGLLLYRIVSAGTCFRRCMSDYETNASVLIAVFTGKERHRTLAPKEECVVMCKGRAVPGCAQRNECGWVQETGPVSV